MLLFIINKNLNLTLTNITIYFTGHLMRAIYTMIKCLMHTTGRVFIFMMTLLLISYCAHASVVINSNRIIYPASSPERTVQFLNNDNAPYMLQVWTDIDNPHSTAESADGPFVANPPIFKISPNSSQMVRLKFIGDKALPQDVESVFYFNFLQIPSLKQESANKNKLAILITTRLKIFYRPDGLSSSPEDIARSLTFTLNGKAVKVTNDSPYHASIIDVSIVDAKGNTLTTIPNASMVKPKSIKEWNTSKLINQKNLFINYSLINDYGVAEKHQGKLQ